MSVILAKFGVWGMDGWGCPDGRWELHKESKGGGGRLTWVDFDDFDAVREIGDYFLEICIFNLVAL